MYSFLYEGKEYKTNTRYVPVQFMPESRWPREQDDNVTYKSDESIDYLDALVRHYNDNLHALQKPWGTYDDKTAKPVIPIELAESIIEVDVVSDTGTEMVVPIEPDTWWLEVVPSDSPLENPLDHFKLLDQLPRDERVRKGSFVDFPVNLHIPCAVFARTGRYSSGHDIMMYQSDVVAEGAQKVIFNRIKSLSQDLQLDSVKVHGAAAPGLLGETRIDVRFVHKYEQPELENIDTIDVVRGNTEAVKFIEKGKQIGQCEYDTEWSIWWNAVNQYSTKGYIYIDWFEAPRNGTRCMRVLQNYLTKEYPDAPGLVLNAPTAFERDPDYDDYVASYKRIVARWRVYLRSGYDFVLMVGRSDRDDQSLDLDMYMVWNK